MHHLCLTIRVIFLALLVLITCPKLSAQDEDSGSDSPTAGSQTSQANEDVQAAPKTALDQDGNLVNVQRDIVPILKNRCLSCHGPDDAKNDFRVDDHDIMMDFIEAGDAESSALYMDYLTTDDPDMLMPPPSKGGPMSTTELALIRVWINEGASWPDDVTFDEESEAPSSTDEETKANVPQDLKTRIWMAQGFLHPATIHFPIALLTFGALFVVLSWKWPSLGTQIPLASLWLGSLSAIVSTLMGWSFAPEQGYGNNWASLDFDSEVDMHRWSGVIVAIVSTLFALISIVSLFTKSKRLTKVWRIGLVLSAGMVGAVGHQGGEMSYGKDFYPRAIRILLGQPEPAKSTSKQDVHSEDHLAIQNQTQVDNS